MADRRGGQDNACLTRGDEHVIMQLEHDRRKMVPVRLSWLCDSEKVRENMKKPSKEQDAIYFFYHNVSTTTPSFSVSCYSQSFDPERPAVYKGYASNRIYDSHAAALDAMQNKRIPMASRKKTTLKSEAELELKTKIVVRRKQNSVLKGQQQLAKSINSSYVVDNIMRNIQPIGSSQKSVKITQPHPQPNADSVSSEGVLSNVDQTGTVRDLENSTSTEKLQYIEASDKVVECSTEGVDLLDIHQTDTVRNLENSTSTEKLQYIEASDKVIEYSSEVVNLSNIDQTGTVRDLENSTSTEKLQYIEASDKVIEYSSEVVNLSNIDQTGVVRDLENSTSTEKLQYIEASDKVVECSTEGVDLLDIDQTGTVRNLENSTSTEKLQSAKVVELTQNQPATSPFPSGSLKKNVATNKKAAGIMQSNGESKRINMKRKLHDATSSESDFSEEETTSYHSLDSYLKEVMLLKQRLKRKNNAMKKLNARIEKLERNGDICRDLNFQFQQQHFSCRCKVEENNVNVNKPIANEEMFTFTPEQKMLLARHVLPEDVNKYIGDMASFLFTEQELLSITAANLDKTKITFMSRYLFKATNVHMSEPGIKEILNKKRNNSTRNKNTPPKKKSNTTLKKQTKQVDEVDLNEFLLLKMQTNDGSLQTITTSKENDKSENSESNSSPKNSDENDTPPTNPPAM